MSKKQCKNCIFWQQELKEKFLNNKHFATCVLFINDYSLNKQIKPYINRTTGFTSPTFQTPEDFHCKEHIFLS